ncbi:hypothetical protein [Silvibacterium sp.]|uniref:hypothetical protein n=1 Tax=Silvibacterium sp. TaxID=1964179 RepID=UPI0039E58509
MAHQPNLFSPQPPPAPVPPRAGPPAAPRRASRWMQRLDLFVRVIVRLYLGLILVVLPWLRLWDDNHLLVLVPGLSHLALSGVTRGLVSGLGLLNVWIAIHDALHYNEV